MSGRKGREGVVAGEGDLKRSPMAWLKFVALCSVVVIGPGLLLSNVLRPSESSNPRRNLTPAEEERQSEAIAEAEYYRKQQRHWIEQVEAGEISFSEAACEFDRGGEWDSDKEICLGGRHQTNQ